MPLPNPGTPPTIDALPEAPLRNQDGPTFNNKAALFVAALDPFGDDVDSVGTWMQDAADFVEEQAGFAEDSATAAATSETAAANVANFKGSWSSLTGALNKPSTVLHQGAYWVLLNNLADVTTSQPGVTADWAFTSGTRWRTPRTASGALAANAQETIIATSAPADMTLPTFATNDFVVLSNSPASTQAVRLMNSAYTIRGDAGSISSGTNITLRAGEVIHLKAVSASILEVV